MLLINSSSRYENVNKGNVTSNVLSKRETSKYGKLNSELNFESGSTCMTMFKFRH
jgi:hypothetical protein